MSYWQSLYKIGSTSAKKKLQEYGVLGAVKQILSIFDLDFAHKVIAMICNSNLCCNQHTISNNFVKYELAQAWLKYVLGAHENHLIDTVYFSTHSRYVLVEK